MFYMYMHAMDGSERISTEQCIVVVFLNLTDQELRFCNIFSVLRLNTPSLVCITI